MAERFLKLNDDDVESFIEEEENQNTKRKTLQDIALVNAFIEKETEASQPIAIERLSPQQLDSYLSKFLLAVRKKNGEEYEPTTLRGFLSSVERYLRKHRYSESIITGQNFARTREALKSKQKQLKREGKGNKPFEASSLTQEEIDILYERQAMGMTTPQALVNALWFNNCLHFGLRGGKEQRDLKWGDVVLKTDTGGKEYLEYATERQTKTRPGDNPVNTRVVKPRMYENLAVSPEQNPVFLYKLYKSKRPEQSLENDAPFYLSINHASVSKLALPATKWFKPQPMGVNKLNSLMKNCAEVAGIGFDKRITNHSARKTLVQKLQDNNVPPTQIVQVTGHKNLQSVNNYSSLRDNQQEAISSILSSSSCQTIAGQPSNSKKVVSLEMETSHESLMPSSLFHGNYISGGTFNVHVSSASSSLASSTTITESPKRKRLRRLLPLESSDSSQSESQEKDQ